MEMGQRKRDKSLASWNHTCTIARIWYTPLYWLWDNRLDLCSHLNLQSNDLTRSAQLDMILPVVNFMRYQLQYCNYA